MAELEARLALALLADGVDDVAARAPVVEHLGDQLRRILEVGVEHHDGIARGVVEAGGQRRLVAEVARQVDDAHARVGGRDAVERLRRAVGRAVVDEHELEREPVERAADARVELVDRRLLVVDRCDDAQQLERAVLGRRGARGAPFIVADPEGSRGS